MKKPVLIGAVAGAALLFAVGGAAFAAGGSTTSGFSFLGDLASHLGISQTTLKSAVQQTELDKVAYLEQSGRITATQAQNMESAIKSGKAPFGFGRRMHHGMRAGFGRQALSQVATDLGMTPQQLLSDLRGGQTLEQVITAQGKSGATIESELQATLKTRLDQAVANGRLTQSREETILQDFANGFQNMLNRTWPAPPSGMTPPPDSSQG